MGIEGSRVSRLPVSYTVRETGNEHQLSVQVQLYLRTFPIDGEVDALVSGRRDRMYKAEASSERALNLNLKRAIMVFDDLDSYSSVVELGKVIPLGVSGPISVVALQEERDGSFVS